MRCDRTNSTCLEELRKPRSKRQATHPSATVIPAATANYQRTCTDVRLSGGTNPYLLGNCRTQTGENNPGASFHLSDCVSWGIAGLQCNWVPINPLDFQQNCNSCRLEGTVLVCQCGIFISITNRVDLGG
jgi:hypothetical protein